MLASTLGRPCIRSDRSVGLLVGSGRGRARGTYRAARHGLEALGAQRIKRKVERTEAGALQRGQAPRQRQPVARHGHRAHARHAAQLLWGRSGDVALSGTNKAYALAVTVSFDPYYEYQNISHLKIINISLVLKNCKRMKFRK